MKFSGVWEDNNSSEDIIDWYEHCLVDVTVAPLENTNCCFSKLFGTYSCM